MIDEDAPEFVASFARGLGVICAFSEDAPRQTLTEVAERAGITRAAARRFLLTLVALGYARIEGKRFELTPKVLDIGYAYMSSLGLAETLQPYLRRVAEAVGESCSAAVLDGEDVIFIARASARHRVLTVNLHVGARLPAHCTSMGQVLLAFLEPERQRAALKDMRLRRFTDATITGVDALRARLDEVRARGWTLCDEEMEVGLRAIAVPLRDANGLVTLAINLSVQAGQVSAEALVRNYLPILRAAADEFESTRGRR